MSRLDSEHLYLLASVLNHLGENGILLLFISLAFRSTHFSLGRLKINVVTKFHVNQTKNR